MGILAGWGRHIRMVSNSVASAASPIVPRSVIISWPSRRLPAAWCHRSSRHQWWAWSKVVIRSTWSSGCLASRRPAMSSGWAMARCPLPMMKSRCWPDQSPRFLLISPPRLKSHLSMWPRKGSRQPCKWKGRGSSRPWSESISLQNPLRLPLSLSSIETPGSGSMTGMIPRKIFSPSWCLSWSWLRQVARMVRQS